MTLTIAVISFVITLAVGTVLHEFAHAAGAVLGGLRLSLINLGEGPLL